MYSVTPRNIYLRYLAAKEEARTSRKAGDRAAEFTYETMAEMFSVSPDACYSWTLEEGKAARKPSKRRADKLKAWINDGVLEAYLGRDRVSDGG